ncbi:MAG: hypothetical protein DRJ42_29100 [Deltaproteobacteria bacterium]|nr:MAG: hypothetical protein DRJ42_29100 [Deltaproteobacteria bacterium]
MGADRADADSGVDRYQQLFEHSADAILIIEGEKFVDCNEAAVAMLRCSNRAEVLETHPSELSPPTQPDGRSSFEKANEMMALARAKGSHRFVWHHLRRDGEAFPVEVLLTTVQSGATHSMHVVWRDLSERWYLEEQLRQSQKMQAVGELAGGIAHDFNNLLVIIFGHCSSLERLSHDAEALQSVSQIRGAGDRAAALVRQLMSFSRARPTATQVIHFGQALDSLRPLLERVVRENIVLDTSWDEDPPVLLDPSQFDQLVINLVSNARDAIREGGTIRVSISVVSASPGGLPPGDYAHLSVTDDGEGMDAATQRRAFDPLYTTKPAGEGTGFGLAMVYGAVIQCGGHVCIESELGRGTTMNLYFPVSERAASAHPEPGPEVPELYGDESILVVEDDPAIAALVTRELSLLGYQVEVARNGQEGLDRAEVRGDDAFDLIVSDVLMPVLGGGEMVEELVAKGGAPRVLFISGYTDRELTKLQDGPVDLLRKPFTPQELAIRVRRALDRPTKC